MKSHCHLWKLSYSWNGFCVFNLVPFISSHVEFPGWPQLWAHVCQVAVLLTNCPCCDCGWWVVIVQLCVYSCGRIQKDAVNWKHISVHSLCWSGLHSGVTCSFKPVSFVEQCDDWCYFCAIFCCSQVVCTTVLKRPVYLGSLCFNQMELCCHSGSGCLAVEPQTHSCFVLSKS